MADLRLADFVARLRNDLKNPPREEQAATTDEQGQAVRLMTIHQAKGLEFPIVIVPDLDRTTPNSLPTVTIHPLLGPVARPCDGDPDDESDVAWSLGWDLFKAEEDRAESEEAIRLFYVAVTRAQDALILSSGSDPAADGGSPALRLLASRFDRIHGNCLAELPEGWPAPSPRVIVPPVSGSSGRSSRAGFRPKLLVTARRIERSVPRELPENPIARSRPRFVDLEAIRGLGARVSRLDGLLRFVVSDPALFDPTRLDEVLIRASKLADGWPSARFVDEIRDRIRPWLSGRGALRIAKSGEVRRRIPWTLAWPFDDPLATVFRGRIDLAFRAEAGAFALANFCLEESPSPVERLNLLLGSYAADAMGVGPVDSAILIRLGAEAGVTSIKDFGREAIDEAVAAVFSTSLGRGWRSCTAATSGGPRPRRFRSPALVRSLSSGDRVRRSP